MIMTAITQTSHWGDSGTEPTAGVDDDYAVNEQPVAEWDNWINKALSNDIGNVTTFSNRLINVVTKTTTYTALSTDRYILADVTAGGFTITLPTAASIDGVDYIVKKVDSTTNVVTIDANGAETIDGGSDLSIAQQYTSYTVVSDGSNWVIV